MSAGRSAQRQVSEYCAHPQNLAHLWCCNVPVLQKIAFPRALLFGCSAIPWPGPCHVRHLFGCGSGCAASSAGRARRRGPERWCLRRPAKFEDVKCCTCPCRTMQHLALGLLRFCVGRLTRGSQAQLDQRKCRWRLALRRRSLETRTLGAATW